MSALVYFGLSSEITHVNVYRKAGVVADATLTPIENYVKKFEALSMLVEPLNPQSPISGGTWNATHRLHSEFREDLRAEDRVVELDKSGVETSTRYTILHINVFRPHHLEIYAALDSQPLVV